MTIDKEADMSLKEFSFNDLFIFDMANNHQGDLRHGLQIIAAFGDVAREAGVRAALKFQFRQLDTFIHPDFRDRSDLKHIPRFMQTALSAEDFRTMADAVRRSGMITMCTPFDEGSVDVLLDLDIEVIKIASCSAGDRPLLERVAEINKPVIVSTAGLSINNIDRLVSFLEYKGVRFALMHCVALYPTPNDALNLNQITFLRSRYPNIPVGFSTHEEPSNMNAVRVACAKGARLFERHVGLETDRYRLNAYSSLPRQIRDWIGAYQETAAALGGEERAPAAPAEIESLRSLMRGVYAKREIPSGTPIGRDDVFFAMPLQQGQLVSGAWFFGMVADREYSAGQALDEGLANYDLSDEERIFRIMLQVKGMLNNARIFVGRESSIEISHHYGLERFREFGCVIVNCINRAYCKKLIIQLPRQKHPYHYHAKKEESFQLLYGDLEVELEGHRYKLSPGDTFLVQPMQWHKFHTLDGAVFEEVSTTHYNDDSFYEDERIAKFPRARRKTAIPNWESAMAEEFQG